MDKKKLDFSLSGPGVVDKYKDGGLIAQNVLKELIEKCQPGADVHELCQYGNQRINEEVGKIYNNKKFQKGIAFPVCISLNNISGHFCPLKEDSVQLKDGDLVKIDLGVQIDAFPVMLAHTVLVGKHSDPKKLNLLNAGYNALENAVKALRPKHENYFVTKTIEKIC